MDCTIEGALWEWMRTGSSVSCDTLLVAPSEPPIINLASELTKVLRAPCGSRRLRDLARSKRKAVIITSDATRAVPTSTLLGPVVQELHDVGIPDESIEVVIATGAHRAASDPELSAMIGRGWLSRLRVSCHEAFATDSVFVGETRRGNRVRLNRRVAEAGIRIAFGVVEPHLFAGFSGGAKSILPGVASYESILHVHSVDILSDPQTCAGVLEGNPVYEEIVQAGRLAQLDFIVNVAVNSRCEPIAVAAGDFEVAHRELVRFIADHSTVDVAGPTPDVIVTGPNPPQDLNLYQSVKALAGVTPIAGPDTSLLLLSACKEGCGSKPMLEAFRGSSGPGQVLSSLRRDYAVEENGALVLAKIMMNRSAILACCPGVGNGELRAMMFEPVSSPLEGLTRAVHRASMRLARPRVVFVPGAQRLLLSLHN